MIANRQERWVVKINGRQYTKSKRKMTEDQFRSWVELQLPVKPISVPSSSNSIIRRAEKEIAELLKEYTITETPIDIHNTKPQIYKGREYKLIEQKSDIMIWNWEDVKDSNHYGYDVFDSRLGRYPETYEIISYGTCSRAIDCATLIC